MNKQNKAVCVNMKFLCVPVCFLTLLSVNGKGSVPLTLIYAAFQRRNRRNKTAEDTFASTST